MNKEVKSELHIIWTHIKKLCSLLHLGFLSRIRTVIIEHPIATFRVLLGLLIIVIFGSYILIRIVTKSSSDREMHSTYLLEQKIDSLEMTHHADSVLLDDMRSKLKTPEPKSNNEVKIRKPKYTKSKSYQEPKVETSTTTVQDDKTVDNPNKINENEQ